MIAANVAPTTHCECRFDALLFRVAVVTGHQDHRGLGRIIRPAGDCPFTIPGYSVYDQRFPGTED